MFFVVLCNCWLRLCCSGFRCYIIRVMFTGVGGNAEPEMPGTCRVIYDNK
jgi:hypothetical protein